MQNQRILALANSSVKVPPSFSPFVSESGVRIPSITLLQGWGSLYFTVRTAPGPEHNCNNPMGGMSESCQSPLDCLWTPPEIHNDWNIKVELNAKMICLDKKIKYVCVWPLDGVLQDGHNFILKWVCMLKPLSHSSKNYFRNLVHILGLNNLIMLFIKIWILT